MYTLNRKGFQFCCNLRCCMRIFYCQLASELAEKKIADEVAVSTPINSYEIDPPLPSFSSDSIAHSLFSFSPWYNPSPVNQHPMLSILPCYSEDVFSLPRTSVSNPRLFFLPSILIAMSMTCVEQRDMAERERRGIE